MFCAGITYEVFIYFFFRPRAAAGRDVSPSKDLNTIK